MMTPLEGVPSAPRAERGARTAKKGEDHEPGC